MSQHLVTVLTSTGTTKAKTAVICVYLRPELKSSRSCALVDMQGSFRASFLGRFRRANSFLERFRFKNKYLVSELLDEFKIQGLTLKRVEEH